MWQHNTAHALCMLDNSGYIHILRICNTYCFCNKGYANVAQYYPTSTLYILLITKLHSHYASQKKFVRILT